MTNKETISEVLNNSDKIESNEINIEKNIEEIAKETISDVGIEDNEKSSKEELTIDNVALPEEKKELTNEDYILRRKERQIEREQKRRLIDEKNSEIERLRRENDEANKKAFLSEINSFRPPIREDFETDEEFIDSRWKYNLAKTAAERIQQEEQVQILKSREVFIEKLSNAEQTGQDKYHDFDQVVEELGRPGVLTNKTLVDAVLDSDYSADVFYLLGKYPSIREKLNSMEPIRAIKELAKLEQRFEQQLKSKKVVNSDKKIIEPLNGKNGTSVKKPLEQYSESELSKLTSREFTNLMKEQAKSSTY